MFMSLYSVIKIHWYFKKASKQLLWFLGSWLGWVGSQVTSRKHSWISFSLTFPYRIFWAPGLTCMGTLRGKSPYGSLILFLMVDDRDWNSVPRQGSRKWSIIGSLEFSRQEYWRVLPFPSPGDLYNPGIKPGSPTVQATVWATRETHMSEIKCYQLASN